MCLWEREEESTLDKYHYTTVLFPQVEFLRILSNCACTQGAFQTDLGSVTTVVIWLSARQGTSIIAVPQWLSHLTIHKKYILFLVYIHLMCDLWGIVRFLKACIQCIIIKSRKYTYSSSSTLNIALYCTHLIIVLLVFVLICVKIVHIFYSAMVYNPIVSSPYLHAFLYPLKFFSWALPSLLQANSVKILTPKSFSPSLFLKSLVPKWWGNLRGSSVLSRGPNFY